jgi:hypothetical protein
MNSNSIINKELDNHHLVNQICERRNSLEAKVRNWESMLHGKFDQVILRF